MTAQSYIDRWVTENPFPLSISENGEERLTTQAEYDAILAERTITLTKQYAADQAEDARRDLRRLIRNGLPQLESNHAALSGAGALTNAQLRTMLDEVTRFAIGLTHVLMDRHLIERDDG